MTLAQRMSVRGAKSAGRLWLRVQTAAVEMLAGAVLSEGSPGARELSHLGFNRGHGCFLLAAGKDAIVPHICGPLCRSSVGSYDGAASLPQGEASNRK